MMEITWNESGQLQLTGRFDASQEAKARTELDRIAESVVIDLSKLDYISSAGLGVLIHTHLRLSKEGKNLTLRNMNPHISNIFQLSGLVKLFHID
jgi:anti-anti-sigma factor